MLVAATLTLCLAIAGCGGGEKLGAAAEPEAPVGSPMLPDLMPKPQFNVLTQKVGDRWRIRFSTTIVNVGEGDFILRAVRNLRGGWKAEQDIPYSEKGARRVPVRASLVWGGDGHNHWHINRVAVVELVPLGKDGRVEAGGKVFVDGKVGFCFYDFAPGAGQRRAERKYSAKGCGKQDWTVVGMGLSPGWSDTYRFRTPGPVDRRHRRACRKVPALHRGRPAGMVPRSEHTEQPHMDRHRAQADTARAHRTEDRHRPDTLVRAESMA